MFAGQTHCPWALQTFPEAAQLVHVPPLNPQAWSFGAVMHCPLEQHPFAQVCALQLWQVPPTQSEPAAQHSPLQHCVEQFVPGWPFGWLV